MAFRPPVRGRAALALGLALLAAPAVAPAQAAARVETGSAAAHGARILRYEVDSRFVHRRLAQTAVVPAGGGRGRPLLVFLHGQGGNSEANSNADFYAALRSLGRRAPAVIFPSGGRDSYYHARGSGDWERYVLEEVIPQAVARLHADGSRVAIGGISMGGFGALHLARLRRFCGVGGHSAALWLRSEDAFGVAFDDPADFERHDLVELAQARGRAPWRGAWMWLDVGDGDPFRAADAALASALDVRLRRWIGLHDGAYWTAHYRRYLRFYASALQACGR